MLQNEGAFRRGFGLYENGTDQIAPWVPGGLTTLGTDGFAGVTLAPI